MTRTNFYQRKVVGCYLIQHRETLRSYCGQSRDVLSRWRAHCSGGKKATGIGAAIRDEGVDSFTFRVLEECDVSQLNEREVFWIAHYDCVEPHGYNRNSGGGAPTHVSDKTKAKISAAAKGKKKGPHSPAHIEKLRASAIGNTYASSDKGKHQSPAAIAARVESLRLAKAALTEPASYTALLQSVLDTLRHDKTYIPVAAEVKPPSASPSPTLAELDALLKEWEGL